MNRSPGILIIHPDQPECARIAGMIERLSPLYRAHSVVASGAALRACTFRAPAAVIVAEALNDNAGLALVRALRTRHRHVPIIVLAADALALPDAEAAGATYVLDWPAPLAQLGCVLDTCLPHNEYDAVTDARIDRLLYALAV